MQKLNALLQILLITFFGLSWQEDFHRYIPYPKEALNFPDEEQSILEPALCNLKPPPYPPEVVNFTPDMPYLASCDHLSAKEERKQCSDQKILKFIIDHFKPPLKTPGCSKIAVVSFIIDTTGTILYPKVVRSVAPDFDAEALRVVRLLPAFKSGKKDGKLFPVRFNIPFRVRME